MTALTTFKATDNKTDKEPALKVGTSVGAVAGILSIIAFLWPDLLSNHATSTILIISTFALPLITAVLTRRKTWSVASVTELVEEAVVQAEIAMKDETMGKIRSQYRLTPIRPSIPPQA